MRNFDPLRKYIRIILEKKDVIGEPDLTNKEERDKELRSKEKKKEKNSDEASVAAGMPGVSTPLGTGPTYPAKVIKKNKKRRKTK